MWRVNWNFIKGFLLMVLMCIVFAFSANRNNDRLISQVTVNFEGENNLFITEESVNKLLIVKNEAPTRVPKEILDLNGLEIALNSNPMIKNAQVYLTVNGEVRADVMQRNPIARVSTNASYYIDDEGKFMPLSANYSARVPLVTGHVEKNKLNNVFKIASKIYNDPFLRQHIVEIHQSMDQSLSLKSRVLNFKIVIGNLDHLDKKINNFKAFYQKAKRDNSLEKYETVNLQFENQVVCTKK
jgi:cell division protein FtsQ